ncbi:MAG TPA: hypothetical protein VKB27_09050 [Gammaproteobacteria bacterium]|nr:hypothetical protein [Gammaproteobacteria bacterium]
MADGAADAAIVHAHLALRYTRVFPELFDYFTDGEAAGIYEYLGLWPLSS